MAGAWVLLAWLPFWAVPAFGALRALAEGRSLLPAGGRAGEAWRVAAHLAAILGLCAAVLGGVRAGQEAGPAVVALGAALVLAGAAVQGAAHRHLPDWRLLATPSSRLGTRGPYAVVRHPIYGAFVLWGLGTTLALPSGLAWASVGLLALMAELRGRHEDRLMAQGFGAAWASWAARTGRWLPGVGRVR